MSAIERQFVKGFELYTITEAKDQGVAVKTEAKVADFKALLEAVSGSERNFVLYERYEADFRLSCLNDVAIDVTQRVKHEGKTYEVKHITKETRGINAHQEVMLQLLQ